MTDWGDLRRRGLGLGIERVLSALGEAHVSGLEGADVDMDSGELQVGRLVSTGGTEDYFRLNNPKSSEKLMTPLAKQLTYMERI